MTSLQRQQRNIRARSDDENRLWRRRRLDCVVAASVVPLAVPAVTPAGGGRGRVVDVYVNYRLREDVENFDHCWVKLVTSSARRVNQLQ